MLRARSALGGAGLAIRVVAGGIWLAAGISKVPALDAFRAAVGRYELLPAGLVAPFASILPFAEIALGLYLACGLFTRGAALVGTLLMAAFLAAQIQARSRGLSIDCGCFGQLAKSSIGWGTILRDFLLALPTVVMLFRPALACSLDRRLFGAADRFAGRGERASPNGTERS